MIEIAITLAILSFESQNYEAIDQPLIGYNIDGIRHDGVGHWTIINIIIIISRARGIDRARQAFPTMSADRGRPEVASNGQHDALPQATSADPIPARVATKTVRSLRMRTRNTQWGKGMNTPHRTVLGAALPLSFILLAAQVSAQSPPTATEAFNLRRQCKKLSDEKAQELLETNRMLKWEIVATWNTSKYDPMDHESDQTFDLQTDDLLAAAMTENEKRHGSIFDPDYKKSWLPLCSANGCGPDFGNQTWQAAEDYMNEFMVDPRR